MIPDALAAALSPAPREAAGGEAPGAIVFGGAHGSLAVIRSLGRRGIPVWFLAHDHLIAKYSRYTRRAIPWPGPASPEATAFLLELAERNGLRGWTLFPGGDPEARLVSENHAALSRVYRLVTPPWKVMRQAHDKRLMYRRAGRLGIGHPWLCDPGDRARARSLSGRFPLVIKPAMRNGGDPLSRAKAWRVDDRAELARRYKLASALVGRDNVIVQELIPGSGTRQFSYAAVWRRGAPVASLVARRTRQYPVDFGFTSTLVETVEDAAVERAACRFLKSLDYDGMVEVEFKYDARDGRYKILDVNTRTWTWIGLGAAAGVDFPWIMWRLAAGKSPPVTRGRTGVKWCHWSRDAVAACQQIGAGALSPIDYLRSLEGLMAFSAFALDDPLPGVMDLPLLLWRLLRRKFPRTHAPEGSGIGTLASRDEGFPAPAP